jgi:beta-galactosidase/beta-glucuronidase
MSNRIVRVTLHDHSLVPASAELRVSVVAERLDAGTQLRGRLMGPRCRFATTVEIAYHLRPLDALTARVIIPEASLWEPETPHLYAGPIELWQDGARADVVEVTHGLRRLDLGPRGLRVNGKPVALRGRRVESLTDAEALALRQAGYNLLAVGRTDATRHVWDVADRVGFLVACRPQTAQTDELARHPSDLGPLSEYALGMVE